MGKRIVAKATRIKFSAKLFNTLYKNVKPIIDEKYKFKLDVIFRQQIQPWHPSSTLTHEAGAAVLNIAPEKFWEFSAALFQQQTEFFDVRVVNETRNETYKRLAKIAGNVGVDEKHVLDLLLVSDKPGTDGSLNIGNGVTNDIKKMTRVRVMFPLPIISHGKRTLTKILGKSCHRRACYSHSFF
jgi:hypothetical protein